MALLFILETLKDWLGILDDVDDFVDRSAVIRERVIRLTGSLTANTDTIKAALARVTNDATVDTLAFVGTFIQSVTGTSEEIGRLLRDDAREVDRLISKAKAKRFDRVVVPLERLRSEIRRTISKFGKLIRDFDSVVRAWRAIRRANRLSLAARVLFTALLTFGASSVALHLSNTGVLGNIGLLKSLSNALRPDLKVV